MYSQQKKLERYCILVYTWKILEGLVPNCGIVVQQGDRDVQLPPLQGKHSVRDVREQSFQVHGPKLLNSKWSLTNQMWGDWLSQHAIYSVLPPPTQFLIKWEWATEDLGTSKTKGGFMSPFKFNLIDILVESKIWLLTLWITLVLNRKIKT